MELDDFEFWIESVRRHNAALNESIREQTRNASS